MILFSNLADAWKVFTQGSDDFATPALTRVQQVSLAQVVVIIAVVLGVELDPDTQQLLVGLSAVLAAVLPASDAVIRGKRSDSAEPLAKAKEAEVARKGSEAAKLSEDERRALRDALQQLGP